MNNLYCIEYRPTTATDDLIIPRVQRYFSTELTDIAKQANQLSADGCKVIGITVYPEKQLTDEATVNLEVDLFLERLISLLSTTLKTLRRSTDESKKIHS